MSASWPTASSRKLAKAERGADDLIVGALEKALALFPPRARCLVAYSGGLDSSVLLHACASSNRAVVACHVHHGLQASADRFVEHCLREAAKLGVQCMIKMLGGSPPKGESVEAWAREQRYAALIACAREVDAQALLTAHHADDQAETLLIRLSRGSGPEGLVGIHPRSAWQGVSVLRPFLNLRRSDLEAYATRHDLRCIDDPMNAEARWLRVALRRDVMPALSRIAPAFVRHAARSAALIGEAVDVIAEVAQADLSEAAIRRTESALQQSGDVASVSIGSRPRRGASSASAAQRAPWQPPVSLDLAILARLGPARRANAIRHWLHAQGAPAPSQARLDTLMDQVFDSGSAHALWYSSDWCVVKYRKRLQAFAPHALLRPDRKPPEPVEFVWRGEARIELGAWALALRMRAAGPDSFCSRSWVVARDQLEAGPIGLLAPDAGLRLRSSPGAVSRPTRKHWQSLGVPPWLRPWIPALSVAGQIIAVPGLGLTDEGVAMQEEIQSSEASSAKPLGPAECGPSASGQGEEGTVAAEARLIAISLEALPPFDPRSEWEIAYN